MPKRISVFISAIACCAALCLTSSLAADEPPPKTIKILLIGHQPDHAFGSHMYLHECGLLAKCLKQTPGIETVVSDRWPKDQRVLDGVQAIVCYTSPGANLLLQGPHSSQAEQLLAGGVGYTAIHWATGAEGKELGERYLTVLGGWFHQSFEGLDVSPSRVVQIDPEHPICRGWKDYDLRDEWYLGTKLAPGAKPLLKVRTKGKDQVVAWTYERPGDKGGRSFGITLGHFHDNFGIESFRKAIVNGILWTAHREILSEGAPVEVAASDMDLGPEPPKKK